MIASLAVETGIPHQHLVDLDPLMLRATLDYLRWRAEEQG